MFLFHKYHALGNDYLVLNPEETQLPDWRKQVERICHRHFGLGSDGILYGPSPSQNADFALRIYNPDGSEAEKSGNGLRIFSRYLWDQKKVNDKPFTIETIGGKVTCQVKEEGQSVTVEMGKVSFDSQKIPVKGSPREVLNETLHLQGKPYHFYAATIGNPHVVLPLKTISADLAKVLGPIVENDPQFPNRTNMQLLKVLDRKHIQIEIWERGAGYTLASGSSSSAAAAVAHKMGSVDSDVTVIMPGGRLQINIANDYAVTMTGGITRVGTMTLDDQALR